MAGYQADGEALLDWGGFTSLDSLRAKLRWIPVVSGALGDLG